MKKLLGRGKQSEYEPPELQDELAKFKVSYQKVQTLKEQLEQWADLTKQLKQLAVSIGKTLGNPNVDQWSESVEEKDETESAISSISAKSLLLQDLFNQYKNCKRDRQEYEKLKKKLSQQVEKTKDKETKTVPSTPPPPSRPASSEGLKLKVEEHKKSLGVKEGELLASLKFVNNMCPPNESDQDRTSDSDISTLLKHDLNAFRVSQFDFLLGVQRLFGDQENFGGINYEDHVKLFMDNLEQSEYKNKVEVLKDVDNIDDNLKDLSQEEDYFQFSDDDEGAPLKPITGLEPLQSTTRRGSSTANLHLELTRLSLDGDLSWEDVDKLQERKSRIKKPTP